MTTNALEVSAQIIGGPESYPRNWGPRIADFPFGFGPSVRASLVLDAATTASLYLRVELSHWRELDGGWLCALATLEDVNGWRIGRRPALIYNRPYDVPTVTSFYVPSEDCVFALSIRKHT